MFTNLDGYATCQSTNDCIYKHVQFLVRLQFKIVWDIQGLFPVNESRMDRHASHQERKLGCVPGMLPQCHSLKSADVSQTVSVHLPHKVCFSSRYSCCTNQKSRIKACTCFKKLRNMAGVHLANAATRTAASCIYSLL